MYVLHQATEENLVSAAKLVTSDTAVLVVNLRVKISSELEKYQEFQVPAVNALYCVTTCIIIEGLSTRVD